MVPRTIFAPDFISARCYLLEGVGHYGFNIAMVRCTVGSKRIYIAESGPEDPIESLLKKHFGIIA